MPRDQNKNTYEELDQTKQKSEKNLNVKFIKGIRKVVSGNDSPKIMIYIQNVEDIRTKIQELTAAMNLSLYKWYSDSLRNMAT